MSLNTAPVNRRSLPYNMAQTSSGSYTLPQHVYIPTQGVQPFSGPVVMAPTAYTGGVAAQFAASNMLAGRPYPLPSFAPTYGFRALNVKASPSG